VLGRIWLAAAGLIAGALSGYAGLAGMVGLATAAVSGWGLFMRRPAGIRLVALATFVFGLGVVSVAARSNETTAIEALADDVPRCRLRGHVLEQAGGLGTLIAVDEAECEGRGRVSNAGVVVADILSADAGARVNATGWLVPLRDDSFDRARKRLGAGASLNSIEVDLGRVDGPLHKTAAALRNSLRSATESMDRDRAALLRGLAIGDTSEMSAALQSDLRSAGLSHLVAVSGSNVAIVLAALVGLVRRLGVATRLVIGFGGLVLFVAVVGPEPSVLRAAVMGGIALAAVVSGRRAEPLTVLGLAIIAVVSVRPALVFSVGLHLSAAATAGIVLWTGGLEQRMSGLPGFVRIPLAATTAAQFAVAPVLVLTFGELSVVALVANVLCAPVVAPATVVAFIAASSGVVQPWLGAAVARLASPLVGWIIEVGRRLGGPGWSSVEVPNELGWPLLAVVVLAGMGSVWRSRARDSD
jgi:ComEC/Rec2-related protein